MTEIKINGSVAYPDIDTITIVKTNPLYSKQGDYTLDIAFPMDIAENKTVFGISDAMDSSSLVESGTFAMKVDNTLVLQGTFTFLCIESYCIKIQVLAGMSEFGGDMAEVSIRELKLGDLTVANEMQPDAMNNSSWPSANGCWPPVIIGDYSFYNFFIPDYLKYILNSPNTNGSLNTGSTYKAKQPYLCEAIKRIINALGWTLNSHPFSGTPWTKLYIVHAYFNTNEFAKVLPDWTVLEFFQEVRKLMNVEFLFDIINKKIDIVKRNDYYNASSTVYTIPFGKIINYRDDIKLTADEMENTMNYSKFRFSLPSDDWYMAQDVEDGILTECKKELLSNQSQYTNDEFVKFYHDSSFDERLKFAKVPNMTRIATLQHYGDWKSKEDNDGMEMKIVPAKIEERYCIMATNYDLINLYYLPFPVAYNYASREATDAGLMDAIQNGMFYDHYKHSTMFVAFLGNKVTLPVAKGYAEGYFDWKAYSSWVNEVFMRNFGAPDGTDNNDNRSNYDLQPSTLYSKYYVNTLSQDLDKVYRIRFEGSYDMKTNAIWVINGKNYLCVELRFEVENNHISNIVEGDFIRFND